MIRGAIVVAVLLPVCAFAARDPNWPCQQIKVPELSLASVWTGPAIDPNDDTWKNDLAVTELVQQLAPRREPIDQAEKLLHDFAEGSGNRKQPQLLQVLVGVFNVLGQERDSVMAGLSRFGNRQRELAAEIRNENTTLRALQSDAATEAEKLQRLTEKLHWDVQVFQDRSQALSSACDIPTRIDQRFFILVRQIQRELE